MRNSKRRVGETQNSPNCRSDNGHGLEIERGLVSFTYYTNMYFTFAINNPTGTFKSALLAGKPTHTKVPFSRKY